MREVALAREIHDAGVSGMQYLYMGAFYILPAFVLRSAACSLLLVILVKTRILRLFLPEDAVQGRLCVFLPHGSGGVYVVPTGEVPTSVGQEPLRGICTPRALSSRARCITRYLLTVQECKYEAVHLLGIRSSS